VLMSQLSFEIPDAQQKEWFIAALTPNIRLPMMQQKMQMQNEALEVAMKLEASPIGEASVGMAQIQTQLANLTIQIQDMKKGKERMDDIWCIKCKTQGHDKDHCPLMQEYLGARAPNPLNQGAEVWCEICRNRGHRPEDCYLL